MRPLLSPPLALGLTLALVACDSPGGSTGYYFVDGADASDTAGADAATADTEIGPTDATNQTSTDTTGDTSWDADLFDTEQDTTPDTWTDTTVDTWTDTDSPDTSPDTSLDTWVDTDSPDTSPDTWDTWVDTDTGSPDTSPDTWDTWVDTDSPDTTPDVSDTVADTDLDTWVDATDVSDTVDPDDPCQGLTFVGCCAEGVARWCDGGELQEVDCEGDPCGWDAANGWYYCGSTGEDPSGAWPLECGAAGAGPVLSDVVINEIVYDTPSTDTDTFIELFGPPGASLDGWYLVAINGNGGTVIDEIALTGTLDGAGYQLLVHDDASAELQAIATRVLWAADLQNGPDSLQLWAGDVLVDAVAYGTFTASDVAAGEGDPVPGPAANTGGSIARQPNGVDTDDNASDFVTDPTPTPGAANG